MFTLAVIIAKLISVSLILSVVIIDYRANAPLVKRLIRPRHSLLRLDKCVYVTRYPQYGNELLFQRNILGLLL